MNKQILAILVEILKVVKKQLTLTEEIHAATVFVEVTNPEPISLADYAEKYIGVDASPADIAPDELGCAESVTTIIRYLLPNFKIETATWLMKDQLDADPRFKRVTEAKRGDIILSPTFSGNGKVVGHTGIFSNEEDIMSNSSATGTWERNYTLKRWVANYRGKGDLKIYFYRIA